MTHPKCWTATIAVVATLTALVLIGLIVIYSGLVNVGADDPHSALTGWVLHTTMERSVEHHAGAAGAPDLGKADLKKGAHEYDEMCAICHGRPGFERSSIAQGLNPQAPDLAEEMEEWSPAEAHWIITHGIKMTGMPAFGPTHSPEVLWAVTAFCTKLPGMTQKQYLELTGEGGEPATKAGHDEHTHGHTD